MERTMGELGVSHWSAGAYGALYIVAHCDISFCEEQHLKIILTGTALS